MVYVNYWKPVLLSILFAALIYVDGRPSENTADVITDEKNDSVQQMLHSDSLSNLIEDEQKNLILRKLLNKIRESGLNTIPARITYDTPTFIVEYASQSARTNPSNISSVKVDDEKLTQVTATQNENKSLSRRERNSKLRNISSIDTIREKLKLEYFQSAANYTNELLAAELKAINNSSSKDTTLINDLEKRVSNLKKKPPVIFHFFPFSNVSTNITSPATEQNSTKSDKVDHKYIAPILNKLQALNYNKNKPTDATINSDSNSVTIVNPEFADESSSTTQQNNPFMFGSFIPFYTYPHSPANDLNPYLTNGPANYPFPFMPQPAPYPDISNFHEHRQWTSPFSNYFPILIRDPFQSVLNYFADVVEYGPAADVCQQLHQHREIALFPPQPPVMYPNFMPFRMHRSMKGNQNSSTNISQESNSLSENTLHPSAVNNINFESGKRRYDETGEIEYIENSSRQKRNVIPKKDLLRKKSVPDVKKLLQDDVSKKTIKEIPVDDNKPSQTRASDVGPQISKLVVRRGGVAIAGAGGIATAGSGGTAIVGPGGTAFTTPASSGGVAMVGPGGKVVKVPDITNVLYGRTANSITATGAGHTTFTNKDGEVFTTSDKTGGVAFVNPGGNLIGVQDDQDLQSNQNNEVNEVQLPVGARLLTTGPIIYYNPVYPATNHLSNN